MSTNQTVIDALANEGVVVTEETLLQAMKDQRSDPASQSSAGEWPILASPPLDEGVMTCPRPVKTGTLAGSRPASKGSTNVEEKAENPVPVSADPDMQAPRRIQAVWQGVCTLTGRGKCRIGIHPAPWVFLYEGACGQQRDCGRCSTTKTRVKHRRQWQYNGPKTCNQMKVCQRCDARVGSRTHHAMWSKSWLVESDKEAHRCLRCGEVQTWSTDCGD